MFFDLTLGARKTDNVRQLPPYVDTGWRPPSYFPELRGAVAIGVDTETKETDFDHGPGWGRGEGHIIGVSIAAVWADGRRAKWYFPVRHEVEREYNLDPDKVFGWLREQLSTNIPKVMANALYDYGWLTTENIYVAGPIYDVQFAEAIVDDDALTALDALGVKYLGRGKTADACKEWVLRAYPSAKKVDWRAHLWRTPPRLAGPYAEDDADMPLDILGHQWPIMVCEQTLDVFLMECRLIPMLVRMRLGGVPVDVPHFERLKDTLEIEIADLYAQLSYRVGRLIDNVDDKKQMAAAFDVAGIEYPRTARSKNYPDGQPSFRKEWLKLLSDDMLRDPTGIGKLVNDIREREKLISTFIDGYILGRAKSGRIFCSFHPLRSPDGGTITGRFSSSDPNLQNIPSRTSLGKKVRLGFVPEAGHVCIHKKDYSQIEYRLFAHFAVGRGADEMRARYMRDPTTDYHYDTQCEVAARKGIDIAAMSEEWLAADRKPLKNINFGLIYGQKEKSLAYKAGWTKEFADQFFAIYHGARPFVNTTMDAIQSEVQYQGYVATILGRRTRFDRWAPTRYRDRVYGPAGKPLSYTHEEAQRLFGAAIQRAAAYKGVNYKFQGSAADIIKKSMERCYVEGVYDYIGYPKLTVHDELDWSKPDHSHAMNEAFRYAAHVMETTVECRVPIKVDSSEGATWGNCK